MHLSTPFIARESDLFGALCIGYFTEWHLMLEDDKSSLK